MKIKSVLNKELQESILEDKQIIAALVFGSYVLNIPYRDIDICLVLDKKYSNIELGRKKLLYSTLAKKPLEIHIFQQLPIYIRKRILKEGKLIFCKNQPLLYEIAFSTIKEFEFYKKIYFNYLKEMQND